MVDTTPQAATGIHPKSRIEMENRTNLAKNNKEQLPVFETVTKAYSFFFHHGRELAQLIWPLAVVEFVALWGYFLQRDINVGASMSNKQIAYLTIALCAAIPMIARVQRFAINPHATTSWLDFRFGGDDLVVLRAILIHLSLLFAIFVLTTIAMLLLTNVAKGELSITVYVIAGVAAVAISYFVSRLLLLYPVALSLGKVSVSEAWRITQGHYVRVLLIWGFSTVPFRLIYRLADTLSDNVWFSLPINIYYKTAVYLMAIILPSTIAVLAQIIVTFVAATLVHTFLTQTSADDTEPKSDTICD